MKSNLWCVVITWLSVVQNARGISILGIVSSPSKSHSVFANAIFEEYARSGHSVTVLSPYDVSRKLNHFKIEGIEKFQKNFKSNYNLQRDEYTAKLQLYEEGLATTNYIINHESFKRFLDTPLNVDIIIFDYDYNEALLAIAQRFRCPVFILAINSPNLSLKRLIGNGYPITNLIFQKPASEIGILNALKNVWTNLHEKFLVDFYYQKQQQILYDQVFKELQITRENEMEPTIAKVFTSSLPSPVVVTTKVENLPALHIPEKSIFEYFVFDSLDQFIHSSEQGCIYVSLGSDTDPATLPKDKIYKMFQVFNDRPEKIIWAWNGNTTLFGGSNKFFISKWLPQDDILRHRNIKAFVTNGGSLSIQEAIYHEIPVIGIPLTYEQRNNIDLMVAKGLGVKIELHNLTLESMIWGLTELVENKAYKRRLAFEADLIKTQPLYPMTALKYWITYFYQHRHDDMPIVTQLSVIDYYLSDIYLPLFLILSLILIVSVIFCSCIYKLITRSPVKRKQKLY